jgi:hypothetical protein
MKYALDVLDNYVEDPRCEAHRATAVHFLEQAIAEAEKQEPFKWEPKIYRCYSPTGDLISITIKRTPDGEREQIHPLKREWVGLTDEEIYDYADKFLYQHGSNFGIKSFGKAIEAKLKEKNT